MTHHESSFIAFTLHEKFFEICRNIEPPIYDINDLNSRIEREQFSQLLSVGPFNRFYGFEDLNCNDYFIGIIVTNNYHLMGKMEIHLGYFHRISDNFNVIEKWSSTDNPSIFNHLNNHIDPKAENFNNRTSLINNIVESTFDKFKESIEELKKFIIAANTVPIEYDKIVPVYLDLKNRNRSKTSLITNSGRIKTISNDVKSAEKLLKSLDKENYFYTDFLILISIDRYKLDHFYTNFNASELTASKAYKDLTKKVHAFADRDPNFKDLYEEEQEVSYTNIYNIVN